MCGATLIWTNTSNHEPYAGIHTIFLWDCLVRWLETNDFYNDWTSNENHGEYAHIRKRTWGSNTTMITMSWNLWNYLLSCIKIINKLQNNAFIDSRGYIHNWMGHVRFHTLWRDQYTEVHVAWITVSYTRASFIPIIYSTILIIILAISASDWKQCTTNPSQVIRPSQQTAAQTCTNHKFHQLIRQCLSTAIYRFWSFSSHHQLWPEYTKRILLFLASQ